MICCTGSQTGNEKLQNDYPSHIVMLDLDRQRGCLLGLLAKFYIFCRCEELICSQRRVCGIVPIRVQFLWVLYSNYILL